MATRANIWRPCQDSSLKEIYLNVVTKRHIRGALRNIGTCRVLIVSALWIALRVMPATVESSRQAIFWMEMYPGLVLFRHKVCSVWNCCGADEYERSCFGGSSL